MSENGLRHDLSLQQKQGLVLTPALTQSLHILTLPVLELAEYVREQVEENPALELGEPDGAGEDTPAARDLAYDETAYEENWQRQLLSAPDEQRFYGSLAAAPERDGLSPVLAAREEQGLTQLLRLQLAMREAPAQLLAAALLIIEHLDEDGYLSLSLPRLAEFCGCAEAQLYPALALVQSLEPSGVAARDLRECLRLQVGGDEPQRELILAVIDNHLPDVAKNRVRETARALKASAEQIEYAFTRIRALNPRPAAGMEGHSADTQYIVPDVFVRKIDGEYYILLNENLEPRLHIGSYYRRLDPQYRQDEEVQEYLRQKLAAAQSLIRNIERRRQTIYRLAQIVVERQRGFLEHGLAALSPLTMKEVAEQAELHESTVSRAIAGKYVQTPRGVYEWKFFFPRAYGEKDGEITPAWVKEQLAELIAGEDKADPYSDQRLQELLATRGAKVARRTVAKYREALGIPPRSMRRR